MILLRKETLPATGVVLYPTDEESEKHLRKMKDGDEVAVDAKRARSGPHHRWFFAILNKIFDNQEQFKSVDNMLDAAKLELGYSDLKQKLNGDQWHEPKSISFHDMGQDEFNKFADPAIDKLCIHFKIDRELLEQETPRATTSGEEPESPTPESVDEQDADPAGSTKSSGVDAPSSPEEGSPPVASDEQPPSGGEPTPDQAKPSEASETPVEKSSPDAPEKPDEATPDDDVKPSGEKTPTGTYENAKEMMDVLDICQTAISIENSVNRMGLDKLFPPDKQEVLDYAEKRKAELAK